MAQTEAPCDGGIVVLTVHHCQMRAADRCYIALDALRLVQKQNPLFHLSVPPSTGAIRPRLIRQCFGVDLEVGRCRVPSNESLTGVFVVHRPRPQETCNAPLMGFSENGCVRQCSWPMPIADIATQSGCS